LGRNNKVTFLEKHGTGFPNSTGAYELDPSLVNGQWESAWRPMHLKTDVFCSASLILPDKAGRQINIGGWSLDSTFGVRLFTPDGSPGNPSVNDWEENVDVLRLQVQNSARSSDKQFAHIITAWPMVSNGTGHGEWKYPSCWWRDWKQRAPSA
jgi:hypothetical protein